MAPCPWEDGGDGFSGPFKSGEGCGDGKQAELEGELLYCLLSVDLGAPLGWLESWTAFLQREACRLSHPPLAKAHGSASVWAFLDS